MALRLSEGLGLTVLEKEKRANYWKQIYKYRQSVGQDKAERLVFEGNV